jgi:4-oxalocrotonate tautomerase
MPLVNVHMARGRTAEQKRALMAAITQAVVDTLDAPVASVRVWIDEFEPEEFMAGGETLAERTARS